MSQDERQRRKERPIARGVLNYFPDALAEIAHVSLVGNEQHNAGQPMHWSYGKSADHADCILRHLVDAGTIDEDGLSHTAKVAWRALALLQTELEDRDPALHARRQAAREATASGGRAQKLSITLKDGTKIEGTATVTYDPRPYIGETVTRDVAWADMRAHPSARYKAAVAASGARTEWCDNVFYCSFPRGAIEEKHPSTGSVHPADGGYHGWSFTRTADAP